eukprot:6206341-Pleurochrysis_carterae.AAC.1
MVSHETLLRCEVEVLRWGSVALAERGFESLSRPEYSTSRKRASMLESALFSPLPPPPLRSDPKLTSIRPRCAVHRCFAKRSRQPLLPKQLGRRSHASTSETSTTTCTSL